MDELYRKISGLLRLHHFEKIPGGKGSHEKWQSNISGRVLVVPFNLKSRHTANAILKDAGINEKL